MGFYDVGLNVSQRYMSVTTSVDGNLRRPSFVILRVNLRATYSFSMR
jgi:hypothetical protein